jgi:hypothetical protein
VPKLLLPPVWPVVLRVRGTRVRPRLFTVLDAAQRAKFWLGCMVQRAQS